VTQLREGERREIQIIDLGKPKNKRLIFLRRREQTATDRVRVRFIGFIRFRGFRFLRGSRGATMVQEVQTKHNTKLNSPNNESREGPVDYGEKQMSSEAVRSPARVAEVDGAPARVAGGRR